MPGRGGSAGGGAIRSGAIVLAGGRLTSGRRDSGSSQGGSKSKQDAAGYRVRRGGFSQAAGKTARKLEKQINALRADIRNKTGEEQEKARRKMARAVDRLSKVVGMRSQYRSKKAGNGKRSSISGEAFKTLGLKKGATLADANRAYRDAARKFHPDVHRSKPTNVQARMTEKFRRATEAYQEIKQAYAA